MMKNGVKRYVETGVRSALDTVELLVASGLPLGQARRAAEVMTLRTMARQIERDLGRRNASQITHHLAHLDARSRTRVTRTRPRTAQPA